MEEDEILNARQVAEQNPELDATRRQLFGENYLQDIDQGTGIAQYYTGFGNMPTLNYTPPVVEEAAPVVDTTTPIVDTGDGGGDGITGISTGGDDGIDYSQNPLTQMITTPDGDTMTVKEAFTNDAAYTGTDQSGLGGADGMSGGQATPGAEFADQNPYGGDGTIDDLGADNFPDYQEPTVSTYGDPTLEGYLDGIDLSTGRAETIDTRADQPPSLGFGNAPEADIYQDPIMGMANMNQADVIASDANVGFDTPEQTNAIGNAFNSVKDLGIAGIDQLKDSLTAIGGKLTEGFDNTMEIGGRTIDLGKSLAGGVLSLATGIPGIGFVLNAINVDPRQTATKTALQERGYGFDDIGRLTTGPMAGYSVHSAFGDIAKATLDRIDKIENRTIAQTPASIAKIAELEGFLAELDYVGGDPIGANTDIDIATGNVTGDASVAEEAAKETRTEARNRKAGVETGDAGVAEAAAAAGRAAAAAAAANAASVSMGEARYGDGGPDGGGASNVEASSGDTYGGEAYGYNEAAEKSNDGGGSSGGGGKIVCTMMNDSYGFGSFRNKIWLKHSRDMAPEYQIGYHKIFLPLVKLSKTNKVLKKILEHIAIHRTIDIRQESRNKIHLLGRVYRKILEPICYLVGKYAK